MTKLNLSMSARSLLRQAKCPECYYTGSQHSSINCTWCLERAQLMDNLLQSSQPDDTAIDILCEIYNASLFTEDDANGNSYTAVTDTPYIDEELFERLCNVIGNKSVNDKGRVILKGTCPCGDYDCPGEEFYNTPPEQRVMIAEGSIKKNTNTPPVGPRPPPPRAQVAPMDLKKNK